MNDVQKKFKRQMNQGIKDLKKKDKDRYYEYLRRNHLDDPKGRLMKEKSEKVTGFFKRIIKLIVSISIIFILLIIIAAIISINNKNNIKPSITNNKSSLIQESYKASSMTNTQYNIVNYINSTKNFEDNISKDINQKNNDMNSLNKKLITNNEYINNLQVYKNRLEINISEINKINCPQELEKCLSLTNEMYQNLDKAYGYEVEYYKTLDNKNIEEEKKYCNSYNSLINSRKNELISIYDKFNIRHN